MPSTLPPIEGRAGDGGLRCQGLTKRYGSTLAVDGLDLAVEAGQVFGFLGPNRSGKTTTMRMLLGLVRPTAGRAWLNERPLPDPDGLARVGGALLSPSVTRRLLEEFTARRPATTAEPAALARLTARERQVLDLVVCGRSNTEIARALVVAETTVKTHLVHALDKLGVRDRVHAVVYAYEHGLVTPGMIDGR